jgi:signal transduction histidine kinase
MGLRGRATATFACLGLAVAVAVAVSAWLLTRANLVEEREGAALRQLYADARLVRAGLRTAEADVGAVLASVGSGTAAELLLERGGEQFAAGVRSAADEVPASLRAVVQEEGAGLQRYRSADGELRLALGVDLPAADAQFYELVSLDELDGTLAALRTSLAVGVVGATAAAALVGYRLAARLARPVVEIGDAARRIAAGDLATRLHGSVDPDLRELAEAFNAMVSELEARIRRDIRFAADVTHELRSPVAAMTAAIDVIERRRGELPEQVAAAFDVLAERVRGFGVAVEDLLEISRIDAGGAELDIERLDVSALLCALVADRDLDGLAVRVAPGTDVLGDRRRLGQAIGNLLDNAVRYAGGPTAVVAERGDDGMVRIAVEDRGPGVPAEERATIFGRFARGSAGMAAGAGSGSGLGLALVAEHVGLHGGRVWVEDHEGGGARFVVEVPAAGPTSP